VLTAIMGAEAEAPPPPPPPPQEEDHEPSPPDGASQKQAVQARAVARSGSPAREHAARGGSPPGDMAPLSPELQAMLDAPPFSLDNFQRGHVITEAMSTMPATMPTAEAKNNPIAAAPRISPNQKIPHKPPTSTEHW